MTVATSIGFFILLWLFVGVILGFFSGWYSLMRAFPDRPYEEALAIFSNESGMVGLVSMRGILKLSPCHSGLRVGIMRLFGPFQKNFFVPWNAISVSRKVKLGWRYAELSFGTFGSLRISDLLADRLWQTAPQSWPEKGAPPLITGARAFRYYFQRWLIFTTVAAALFIIVPRLAGAGSGNYPPVLVAILFPAITIGLAFAFQYLIRRR